MKKRVPTGRASDSFAGDPRSVRKYTELCAKYKLLVEKQRTQSIERIGVYKLARWAMRTSSSGLALVSKGAILVQNARWLELSGDPSNWWSWRPLQLHRADARPFSSLRELTLEEARHWQTARGDVAVVRFMRSDQAQTIEVRLERDAAVAGDPIVAVLVHDVTVQVHDELELARARELLANEERMRALGEVTSGVAHDLNNTLHAIRMRLEMARLDSGSATKLSEHLEAAHRILGGVVERVSLLQDFARRRKDRPLGSVDLRQAIEGAIEAARPALEEARVTGVPIEVARTLPALPQVIGSAAEVRHVFLNLILNACDAMPRGGTVRVAARPNGQAVVVTVSDEGTGIATADLPRVFDPFFSTKDEHGSGLGLSMAYGVMTRMGGEISAANGESGGACFTLRFPIAARPATRRPKPARKKTVRALSILLVDDEPENLRSLKRILAAKGHDVDTATSGAGGLERTRKRSYQLVVSDLRMPKMDGWQLAAQLGKLEPRPPVWLLTGWAHEISPEDPRRSLVAAVLAKPIDFARLDELLARLAEQLEHAR